MKNGYDTEKKDSLIHQDKAIFNNKHIFFGLYIKEEDAACSQGGCKRGSLAAVSSIMEDKSP